MQLPQTLFLILAVFFLARYWKTEKLNVLFLAFFFLAIGIV